MLGVKQDISNEDLGRLTYLNQVIYTHTHHYYIATSLGYHYSFDMKLSVYQAFEFKCSSKKHDFNI